MATSEAGMTSEQEMTDTAEEGETPMDTSDPHSPFHNSEDSNSTHETEETESAVSTDRDNWSTTSNTPTAPPTTTTSTPNTPTTPTTLGKKEGLPSRPGIQWKKGERVEAMDYLNKWYPAKIMDIDEEEKAVLIHFEGWNQRYDEWTLMTSEGIRPLTRHSERKERGKKNVKEFRAGEKVLAKWTDCKMYPAKVTAVHTNGSLEVMFYDGFKKTVQPINVKALQGKTSPSTRDTKKPPKREYERRGRRPGSGKARSSSLEEKDGKDRGSLAERRHKHKLIVAGSFLARRERSHSAPSLSERQKKSEIRKRGFGMRTSPVKARKEMSLRTSPGQTKKTIVPRLSPVQAKKDVSPGETVVKRAKKRALSLPAEEGSPGLTPDHQTPSSAPAVPAKRAKSTEKDKSQLAGGLAPKEFVIETDHNLFKCMNAGCSKSFRKENLLDYHIKYYHTQDGHTPQTPASRTKRRKTSSICSTDSDISVSSKGKTTPGEGSASKRKRHISSASDVLKEESFDEIKKEEVTEVEEEKIVPSTPATPVTPCTPLPVDAGRTPGGDTSGVEEKGQEETEDELPGEEVVNCVCGYNEENGLMIQCDVCLCWQHASCFSIKPEALPSKYICFVCENPPGIRDSRRYIHDQDWFKSGQLPSFSFLDVRQSEDNSDTVKATHSLIADVLNVKSVLHSLKQEIKVPNNKNHREMKTWKRICEERRRKSRTAETQSVADITVSSVGTSLTEQDKELSVVSKTDPQTEEVQEMKPVVKFILDTENSDELKKDLKEESPISKSMGCQASLDLSGSSLDRSDDKSFDMSLADNDSDTSTMTASESSVGYSSSFPCGPSASGLGADDTQIAGETDGGERKMEEGDMQKEEQEGNLQVPMVVREEDPADEIQLEDCERSLLLHIVKVQSELNDRLDLIEDQIMALEKADPTQTAPPAPPPATQGAAPTPAKSVLRDVPVLKRSLHSLIRDLGKVKSMAAYH